MRDFKEPFYEGKQCKCCKPRDVQPASFTDIAFDTGVIAERERIKNLLKSITWVSIAKTNDGSRMVSTKDLLALIDGKSDE